MPLGRSQVSNDVATAQTADETSGTKVASFAIHYRQVLDHTGRIRSALPEFARDEAELIDMYRYCVLTREFDAKAIALQRTGQLGTYPSSLGQEAAAVGLGSAMRADDVLLPTYRETGTMLRRGVPMADILRYWGGDERGMAYAGPVQDFPISVPIATHAPHAVGVAYAIKRRGEARAAVCALGDGATSKGEFYEAMNAAGVWQLPVLFMVINNQWAISVPRAKQSRTQTLAQKAIAAGIDSEQVDGNDVIAVRQSVERALSRAYEGRGPYLIEALTYRIADHTTADDARRYRSETELHRQQDFDPIERLGDYLIGTGAWTREKDEALRAEIRLDLERAVEEYLQTPAREPATIFDHLFATLPNALRAQREQLEKEHQDG